MYKKIIIGVLFLLVTNTESLKAYEKGMSFIGNYALNTSVKQIASNATIEYGVNGSLGFKGEYRFNKEMALNLGYQLEKELKSSGASTDAKYSLLLIGYNYFMGLTPQFDLFIGLNYSFPTKSGNGWAAGLSLESQLGYHIGVDYHFAKDMFFRGEYATYRANVKFSNGTINLLEDGGIRINLGMLI